MDESIATSVPEHKRKLQFFSHQQVVQNKTNHEAHKEHKEILPRSNAE
jgi:hypothetical protein